MSISASSGSGAVVFEWHEQQPLLQSLSLEICVQSCTADSNGRLSVLTSSFSTSAEIVAANAQLENLKTYMCLARVV